MTPKVVTFDCASTLVCVRWTPGGFALACAQAIGLEMGADERALYEHALRARWNAYQQVNQLRDPAEGDAFWHRLAKDWLIAIGRPPELADKLIDVAPKLLYESGSDWFELYEDVLPALEELRRRGIRLGVISNWDYSLHRVLKSKGVYDLFEYVVASLEEGVEKPDPRLFHLTLAKFGVTPSEALHVGDDPIDDLKGARDAGLAALLIDRSRQDSCAPYLARLDHLTDFLQP